MIPAPKPIVRLLGEGEEPSCEEILRSLPDWFGIEEAIVQYIRDLADPETFETYVVADDAGPVLGFATVRTHNRFSAEIHLMAVRPEHHHQGIGAALVEHIEALLRERDIEFLQVKTLGPSRVYEPYECTRRFYERCGFRPLEENNLWGEVNPCLIMVKHLGCAGRPGSRR